MSASETERNWMRTHGRSPTMAEFEYLKSLREPPPRRKGPTMVVYHAVALEPIDTLDGPYMDEDTIGIYSTRERAEEGIGRFLHERTRENNITGLDVVIHLVEVDKDLIYPRR